MIQVRNATEADAESLAELNRTFNGVSRPSDRIRRDFQTAASNETVLVATESNAVVGFLCFQTMRSVCDDLPWAEITELYVSPSHRGYGASKKLVSEAIRQSRDTGVSEILVRTNITNEAAKTVLTQAGLEVAPHVVFRKSIGAA